MAALVIALQDIRRALRDPLGILMTLAVPFVLTVALGFVSDRAPFGVPPVDGFDALSYIAPGMALFFMMITVRQAAKTVAEDADRGVRDRLRVAPISQGSIAAGTMASHVIVIFLQLCVLIAVSTVLYGLRWGPLGTVVLLCLMLAVTGGGWVGILVAVGRTPQRINSLGMALTLVFAIVSRSFAAVIPTSPWMDGVARITPNYWGLHAFSALALGGGLSSIVQDIAALALMCAVLWVGASLIGRRPFGRRRTA
jgi:ABC-2 type transport system permease protein